MPLPTKMGFVEQKSLDFFVDTDRVIYQVREHVENHSFGISILSSLSHAILHKVEYLRDLPLRTLNDKLKRYPFVDPLGFDMLLSQMLDEPLKWLQSVTNPVWFIEAIHKAGESAETQRPGYLQRMGKVDNRGYDDVERERRNSQGSVLTSATSTEEEVEEEEDYNAFGCDMKEFTYPYPIKLRELQGMVRPFMEVKSSHHIAGLDAIISETVRGFLALFQHIEAWDRALMTLLEKLSSDPEKQIVMAGQVPVDSSRMKIIAELAAVSQMDSFELSHRLHQVEHTKFYIDEIEVEMVCNKFPFFQEQALLRGLPQAQYYGSRGSHESRVEALAWWRDNNFSHATPTRILATTILGELLDAGLHPDPATAEAFPRVLTAIFGEQILQVTFMDHFTPLLGGFVDGAGFNVPPAEGFRPKSNASRTAESVLVFLRSWVDAVAQYETELEAKEKHREIARQNGTDPGGWRVPDVQGADIVGLLEGEIDIPDEVLNIPCEKQRYAVSDQQKRVWELGSRRLHNLVEHLCFRDRDLGPYINVKPEAPETLAAAWGLQAPGNREQSSLPLQPKQPEIRHDISDSFGLKLVEWPPEAADSTFVRFFAPAADGTEGRHIARGDLEGLPPLPWSFGSDQRNTVIVDVADEKLAHFQCLFTTSHIQPNTPCVAPLGDPFVAPMYILCPKYQHLPVKNGYRLICHSWVFECRIVPTGLHTSSLSLLTDEGEVFEVPSSGCHVGAGHRSKQLEHQPSFPTTKMALKHRLQGMSTVHMAFHYNQLADRWTLVDHSPGPFDTLLQLKPGHAYPLSSGLQIRFGKVTLEAVIYR